MIPWGGLAPSDHWLLLAIGLNRKSDTPSSSVSSYPASIEIHKTEIMLPSHALRMQPTRAMFNPMPVSLHIIQDSLWSWWDNRKRSTAVSSRCHLVALLSGTCTILGAYIVTAAHTISQRLRRLKKIPPELIPLGGLSLYRATVRLNTEYFAGVVLGVALGAAAYSLGSKLFSDKTLRLHRTNRTETFK